jgi:anti-sigma factor RsiW
MSTGNAPKRRIGRDAIERDLDLFYDGELRGLRKWRFERLLRRNPGLQRELETRTQLSALVRDAAPEPESPDLWAGIAGQIASTEVPVESRSSWREWLQPLRLAPALVGVAAAVAIFAVPSTDDPAIRAPGVVRSIVLQGRPVVVLDDSEEATIIWFLDADPEGSEEVADGVRV